ncbi:uncharacterized protein LOC114312611 isoform X2 [Camellia sinensis]|uniref:uncharacterized protein LOC114312611 isoform X2 n=1 Tax=Camellia sinensis TaxID=4442 RepID=UPI0010362506|nr:uncharacterized protein LOC114312611 isoform X2 [Camellia sinensis]
MAAESCVANAKYTYIHDNHKGSLETLDSHHVVVRKSSAKAFIVYLSALLLTTTAFSLFLLQDGSIHVLLWSLFLSAFLVKQFIWKPVEKESIIIMPAFGVQLETHYSRCQTGKRKSWFNVGE